MDPFCEAVESFYVETQEGLFFAVKGLEHPPDRVISVLRYAPDPQKGKREKAGIFYRRFYHFDEQEKIIRSRFPLYLAHDPVFNTTLQSVPRELVRKIYDPRIRLQEMFAASTEIEIEADAVAFARMIQSESGVPPESIGVSGSLLIGLHTLSSDLDMSIFGADSCLAVYKALKRLLDAGPAGELRRLDQNGMKDLHAERSSDTPMLLEKFEFLESRKVNQGCFRNRPYFIRFIRNQSDLDERYGDAVYHGLGRMTITGTVADDRNAIFTPCRYPVSEVVTLEGPSLVIDEIVSFRGRFCEQAQAGEAVRAAGTVERVESKSHGVRHRLLIGNHPEDTMVPLT